MRAAVRLRTRHEQVESRCESSLCHGQGGKLHGIACFNDRVAMRSYIFHSTSLYSCANTMRDVVQNEAGKASKEDARVKQLEQRVASLQAQLQQSKA